MAVTVERTPNPAAAKFIVGVPVGGPSTYRDPEDADAFIAEILAIEGVQSLFLTADFVTVTADPGFDWDAEAQGICDILESTFGA